MNGFSPVKTCFKQNMYLHSISDRWLPQRVINLRTIFGKIYRSHYGKTNNFEILSKIKANHGDNTIFSRALGLHNMEALMIRFNFATKWKEMCAKRKLYHRIHTYHVLVHTHRHHVTTNVFMSEWRWLVWERVSAVHLPTI